MPWAELESLIEPHYPKEGNGRPPVGRSIMLRIYSGRVARVPSVRKMGAPGPDFRTWD